MKQLAAALEGIDVADLPRRFDARRMDELEIYPSIGGWTQVDPHSEESFGYFSGAYEALRGLIRRGASSGLGLLVWIS